MRTTNLTDSTGAWGGLLLDVDAPYRPDLRVEVTTGLRMLLRQGDQPLLFARIAAGYRGVNFLRAAPIRSPIAACRADRARALAAHGRDEAIARWAYAFAGELATTTAGPLHRGQWIITRFDGHPRFKHLRPADRWLLLSGDHEGYINWFTTPSPFDVVPLRTPSPPDGSRIKAYRKQARDGTLPPVLMWWISGLCAHVLLDGHDRFAAALAENREPPILVLALQGDEQDKATGRDWAIGHYVRAMDHAEHQVAADMAHPYTANASINRRLGEALDDIEHTWARTRAWPVHGGITAWQRQADAADLRWLSRIDDPKPV